MIRYQKNYQYKRGQRDMEGNMQLTDTIELMCSSDYKERFKAEYYQNVVRYNRLHDLIIKYEAGTLEFEPTCSIDILKSQATTMDEYIRVLEIRAEIEGIEL